MTSSRTTQSNTHRGAPAGGSGDVERHDRNVDPGAERAPRVKLRRAPWRVLAARVVVNGIAVALVVLILPGVKESTGHPVLGYVALGAIFGLINAFVKPAIQFVALPLLLGSLGLVVILVDIVTFWLLDSLTKLLSTSGPIWVVVAGVLLGLLSYIFDNVLGLVPPILPDRRDGERRA